MKDEGPYLREWIEFHRVVGVEKFYLYDNGSSDNTRRILAPYIRAGIVEYTFFPGEKMQLPAYADAIARHKMDTQWIAFVDLDEFIIPKSRARITEILDAIPDKVSQVVIDWAIFGSNGHEKKPRGTVIENYTMRARRSWLYKSIVNPRMVFSVGCHEHDIAGRTRHISKKVAQINHYHCKSWAEYQKRATRGDAFDGAAAGMNKYQRACFDRHNKNEVYDDAAIKFLPAVRAALG